MTPAYSHMVAGVQRAIDFQMCDITSSLHLTLPLKTETELWGKAVCLCLQSYQVRKYNLLFIKWYKSNTEKKRHYCYPHYKCGNWVREGINQLLTITRLLNNWIGMGVMFLTLQPPMIVFLWSLLWLQGSVLPPFYSHTLVAYAFYALDLSALNIAVRDRWKAVMKSTGRNILV